MLYWALVFRVVAWIAGVLGFTSVAVAAAGIAKLRLASVPRFVPSLLADASRPGQDRSVRRFLFSMFFCSKLSGGCDPAISRWFW